MSLPVQTEQADRVRGRAASALPVVLAAAAALAFARSAIFLLWPHVAFDSDQAGMGLMAKHLVEGRAFPLFLYGQSYILGVEAYLAAPLFLIAGVSIPALKIPVLVINVAVGVLLVWRLSVEARVAPAAALIAALFFVVCAPGTSAAFMQTGGGNVEPLLYLLLLWICRRRPVWFGLVLAIGFLQREFTLYAIPALLLVWLTTGEFWRRETMRPFLAGLRVAAEVWLIVQFLRTFSSAAGPGTTIADLAIHQGGLANLFGRFCVDPRRFRIGLDRLATIHWAALFGTARLPLSDIAMISEMSQGAPGLGVLLGAAMLLMTVRIAIHVRFEQAWWSRCAFCVYLTTAGAISALVYALGRCGVIVLQTMRYDLLSIVGAVGVAGWFMAVEERRVLRIMASAAIVVCAAVSIVAYGRVVNENVRGNVSDKQLIIRELEARGIRYASADYWIAYYVDFATREQIIVDADDFTRILAYRDIVARHRAEAVRISRQPCDGGIPTRAGVYFCRAQ